MKKWVLICSFLLSFSTKDQEVTQGYCGPKDDDGNYGTNCEWNYDAESKTLKIWGDGEIYNSQGFDFPWRINGYYDDIENIVIEEGITAIGSHAFYNASSLENITMPDSLTSIGWNAFNGTTKLTSVIIPNSVTGIGGNSTYPPFTETVTSLYCSEAQKNICRQALEGSGLDVEEVLKTYQKYGDKYFYDGKFYKSPNDIGTTNNIKKRIYTIDEANFVAGDKNRVSIRYR